MPEKNRARLEFPLAGRNDRFSYLKQPPFTTVAARNVFPDAMGRERGGSRPGLARIGSTDYGGSILGLSQVTYIPTSSSRIKTSLVILAGNSPGQLFRYDETDGVVGPLTLQVSGSEIISMVDRAQKLYIANHAIDQTTSTTTYTPKIYDPIAGTLTAWTATDGTIPFGCPCIALWRDRMVLAGGTTNPYGVFMSRQGDPLDWDYSETDAGAAVTLAAASSGQIGDTVTSLTPHADNCLIIGCPTSLWMMQGDPAGGGGSLVNLSSNIGVVDRHAWCTTPDGLFVFLSDDGLYAIPAGCSSEGNPVSLSREKIPSELLNISRISTSSGKIASLAYDLRWRGVHIFVSDRTSTNDDDGNLHWFFDWERKAFYEVQFGVAGMDPWGAVARKNYTSSESSVAMGCRDGVLRKFLSTNTKDDEDESTEEKIDSYVTIGPLGDEEGNTRLDELEIVLDADSGDVTWQVFSGDSHEDAYDRMADGNVSVSGRVGPGRSIRFYPRAVGASLLLRLSSSARWAMEAVFAVLAKIGRTRV